MGEFENKRSDLDQKSSVEIHRHDSGVDGQVMRSPLKPKDLYSNEEFDCIDQHIEKYFGKVETVFHEISSPDIHVDVYIVPPDVNRNYYSLITLGMGAHRMDVPQKLRPYIFDRAELVIALPPDWHIGSGAQCWYWPVELLKATARYPGENNTWIAWGHSLDYVEPFDSSTELCGSILAGAQNVVEEAEVCVLPNGESVVFYQIIPLYRDEIAYKKQHGVDEIFKKLSSSSFVLNPKRPSCLR